MRLLALASVAALALLGTCLTGASHAAERFEVAAWVDHYDFAAIKRGDGFLLDTETAEGCAKILDHVQEVGATTILWRNCAGATMRYQSKVETHHQDAPLDKRKVPDSRPVWGWVRYGAAEPDLLRTAMDLCSRRGLRPGVHWPYEETHWAIWTIGGWNLEHPRYWARTYGGQPWWGRCSIAFDEVLQHKMALIDELVDRGIESLFIDTYRNGGWSPAYEYVEPVIHSWRDKYGTEPPADPTDENWCRHVAGYMTNYLREVRKRLDASGRKIDLMVGIPDISATGKKPLISLGADWQTWIDEGIIDTLVINWVKWDTKAPFDSTRKICRDIMDVVDGRCRVLWPVRAYDYSSFGMPTYQKATGLSQAQVASKLMTMAWEEGADGVSLECVDYGNYSIATRKAMAELAGGECRWVKQTGK